MKSSKFAKGGEKESTRSLPVGPPLTAIKEGGR